MKHDYSERILLQKAFLAGTFPLKRTTGRLWKLDGGAVFVCRQGSATVNIDLKDYTITPDTGVVLLPGTLFRVDRLSEDFTLSLCSFSAEMFQEAAFRVGLGLFGFLKDHPCGAVPDKKTETSLDIIRSIAAIYGDKQNTHRDRIAKMLLRCLLLDFYDKTHRYFDQRQLREGNDRKGEIFRRFMALIHEFATSEREVTFYADKLCISAKYLTSVCRQTVGASAKAVIDHFVSMEIKLLLQSTTLTIQEISDRLRFPDQSYMGRYFKRHEGVSPKDYRANCSDLAATERTVPWGRLRKD